MTLANDLDDNEMEAVDELRERFKGEIDNEKYEDVYMFLRFLKARDFNINHAEVMLKKHLQWREKSEVKDALKFEKSEVMEKYCPNLILGFDKEGCPIRYAPVGNMDFTGLIASSKMEDMTKLMLYEIETETDLLQKQTKKLGRNVDKCSYIYNFENFSFAQATDKKTVFFLISLLDIFLNNCPERLKAAYIFNVPGYFYLLYSALKSFLPKTVLNKIRIYSDDSYKEDLLEVIDADVLPAFLGGNKTDPDGNPLCLTFINHGGKIPESYYLSRNKRSLAKSPGVQKVTLSRAAFHEVNMEVKEQGSYLEWEFETKCRDIGFGLFYQETIDGEEVITEIIPIQRIDTDLYPETGTYRCENTGTYVIVFDNTYSWVRAKEIYFRTKLASPKEYETLQLNN